MRRHLDLEHEQDDRKRHQRDAGAVRVERAEREEREEDGDDADDPREDESGVRELEDEPVRPEREEQYGDLRVDDEVEEALDGIEPVLIERRVLRLQADFAGRGRHGAPVDLRGEIREIGRLEVDDLQRQRLVDADAHALAHRVLGPLLVPAADLRDVRDVRDRVVLRLEAEVALDVGPVRVDGMRGADVRRGGHRRDIPGHGDERPGGGRASALGRDEGHDRDLGREEPRGDLVGRVDEASRRVDHEDDRRGTVGLTFRDDPVDVPGGDRIDLVGDVADEDRWRPVSGERACGQAHRPERNEQRRRRPEDDAKAAHASILDPRGRTYSSRSLTGTLPRSTYQSATQSPPYFSRMSSTVRRRSASGSVDLS